MRLVVCKVAEQFVKNNEIAQVNFVPRESRQRCWLLCWGWCGCGQREQKALLHNLSPHWPDSCFAFDLNSSAAKWGVIYDLPTRAFSAPASKVLCISCRKSLQNKSQRALRNVSCEWSQALKTVHEAYFFHSLPLALNVYLVYLWGGKKRTS